MSSLALSCQWGAASIPTLLAVPDFTLPFASAIRSFPLSQYRVENASTHFLLYMHCHFSLAVYSFCRVGFTCRCIHSVLFGIPTLPGGQAQYVRVPKAGGTLFKVDSISVPSPNSSTPHVADSSLLLLADILPTGVFAAVQALQHAKLGPMVSAVPYPFSGYMTDTQLTATLPPLSLDDRILTFAVVGLGPVGVVR